MGRKTKRPIQQGEYKTPTPEGYVGWIEDKNQSWRLHYKADGSAIFRVKTPSGVYKLEQATGILVAKEESTFALPTPPEVRAILSKVLQKPTYPSDPLKQDTLDKITGEVVKDIDLVESDKRLLYSTRHLRVPFTFMGDPKFGADFYTEIHEHFLKMGVDLTLRITPWGHELEWNYTDRLCKKDKISKKDVSYASQHWQEYYANISNIARATLQEKKPIFEINFPPANHNVQAVEISIKDFYRVWVSKSIDCGLSCIAVENIGSFKVTANWKFVENIWKPYWESNNYEPTTREAYVLKAVLQEFMQFYQFTYKQSGVAAGTGATEGGVFVVEIPWSQGTLEEVKETLWYLEGFHCKTTMCTYDQRTQMTRLSVHLGPGAEPMLLQKHSAISKPPSVDKSEDTGIQWASESMRKLAPESAKPGANRLK